MVEMWARGAGASAMMVVLCVLPILLGAFLSPVNADLASQESALMKFKQGLEDPDPALESWNPYANHACSGTWRGLTCDDDHTSVTELTLEGKDFKGHIPDEIRNLKFLRSLTIRKTAFAGTIPQAIADLRNLKNLIIASNPQISGNFPKWILDLSNLQQLSLAGNNLTGTIPSFNLTQTISKWTTLPVTGSVTIPVQLPVWSPMNVTLPNVPVPVLTPVNITIPNFPVPTITPVNITIP